MANLIVLLFFSSLAFVVVFSVSTYPFFMISKIQLPPGVRGPESVTFDAAGGGPYVTVADGRILKWDSTTNAFVEFAYTAPNRNKKLCDGTTDPNLGPLCGRPLGFSFNYATGFLYICDAYLGFLVVGPTGGLATQLATSAEGVPFKFTTGISVDQTTGLVYFSHASETYNLWNATQPGFKPDSTGRLLKYDPVAKQVTVLLRGLSGAAGAEVSLDSFFVLVSEYGGKRIQKFWLTGPKANTAEILTLLPGNPNKIKKSATVGEFWVAVNVITQQPTLFTAPQGQRFNGFGFTTEAIPFVQEYFNASIAVVQEYNSALYVGSRDTDYIGVFKKVP